MFLYFVNIFIVKKTMKDLIKKLIREELEEEIRKKTKIGGGKDHNVYDFEKNPNKVIKVSRHGEEDGEKMDPEHIKTFIKYPMLFPKVYKNNPNYAIIEKLNTVKPREEQELIFNIFSKYNFPDLEYMNKNSALNDIYWQSMNRAGLFNKIYKTVSSDETLTPEERELAMRYLDFFLLIKSTIRNYKRVDMHSFNIGYDSNNELKLLDF
jgi:hypothetical protein